MASQDPLPSWGEGATKDSITAFVEHVTNPGDPAFVPENRRIATFDNDGTLWVSHPIYTQFQFAFDRVKQLAASHPEWKDEQPYKAILEGDREFLKQLTPHDVVNLVMETHAHTTPKAFEEIVRQWLKKARHPRYDVPYTELAYQPMEELLGYLRANGFKTFIVTGGGIEFVRAFAMETYGIPPWQVVGSSIKSEFELENGKGQIMRLPEIEFIDDGPGKPVGITTHIGVRPIAAFGNSDGDIEMLQYTDSGAGPTLAMMVHHDDPEREYGYTCDTKVGALCKGVELAKQRGWVLISMKNDWKRIFSFDESPKPRVALR
ncbi:MAG: HAD family hydrolase [Pseudomonadota bacterium]|nr:HAD family hydrolase [Pseudomonadota bacterium]